MNIPFTEPVVIITLLLVILLLTPVFSEKLRIPSIVGLLISGALIGPHGFNLLPPDLEFSLLGTIGLLYLMFLAGLEIDIIDFINNKWKSIFIGIVSFVFPFLLGFLVSRYLLSFSVFASWLIGAMLASHTLISYPLLGRLGIVNKPIVTIVVGATIIADVLALVGMEVITNFAEKGFNWMSIIHLGLNFIIFFVIVLFIFPRFSRFFFNRYEGELGLQYIFVLTIVFLSAFVAHMLHIEPIIGAFFSGLILNRLIFNTSPLYKRIEFIGNNLFIPFFIISIGLLANFKVYIDDPIQIVITLVLIFTAFISKYLAAWIGKVLLNFSETEKKLIFGLSVSRAASAIAIVLIGFNMQIVDETVLNNTVILILATSIWSSYVSQKAGKKLLLKEHNTIIKKQKDSQRILVPLANPATMKNLLEFAMLIKAEEKSDEIYALSVFTQHDDIREKIINKREKISEVIESLQTDVSIEIVSRIDNNATNGIVRAAEELTATKIIIGWNNHSVPLYKLFGDVLYNLLGKTKRMVVVLKTPSDFRHIKKINVFCPANAEFEKGFYLWIDTLKVIGKKFQIKLLINCETEHTIHFIQKTYKNTSDFKYFNLANGLAENLFNNKSTLNSTDLNVFVHSRRNRVSYNKRYEQRLMRFINSYNNNTMIVYPEQ